MAGQDEEAAVTPLLDERHLAEEGADSTEKEEEGEEAEASISGTAWPLTACIMVGEMLGVGTLSMPADFARLGCIAAIAVVELPGIPFAVLHDNLNSQVLAAMGGAVAFSGVMFSRLGQRVPKAKGFDDIASAAYGYRGRLATYCTVYLAIVLVPALLHLTSAESLMQIFARQGMTRTQANLIVAAVIIPLSQVRGLEHVSWLSLVGTLGMMTAMAIACIKLLLMSPSSAGGLQYASHSSLQHTAPRRRDAPPSDPELQHGFYAVLVALMDAVFAYGGQQNWVRYLSGVRSKADFKYSATAASAIMTACFAALGAIGYMRLGTHFDQSQPITSVLPHDGWTPLMNIGLLAHCILAYQIDLNVWAHTLLLLAAPQWADPLPSTAPSGQQRRSAVIWLATTLAGAAFATAVAAAVPFFSTVMGLIAAVGDMSAAFILPALFCLRLVRHRMRAWEVWLCWALIPVATVLAVLGTWSSGLQLVLDLRHHHRKP